MKTCTKYTMAGILFTNEKLFLSGYKSFKGHITGIGGKQQQGESLLQTAIRETIEELFGIKDVPSGIVRIFEKSIHYYKVIENGGFTHFLCSFDELNVFLGFVRVSFDSSPYYDRIPHNLEELLLKRKNVERAEITHLCLLPFVFESRIARHLISDINLGVLPASTT